MHRLREDSLRPEFSTEKLQTYIKFCRTIKPRFTKESALILKDEYKKMRLDKDRSYKVTVRALESLIRLSEAIARAHCDTEIKPSYVKEVCRLMRQSNIKLVRDDLEFGDMADIQDQINVARRIDRDVQMQQQDGD